MSNVNIKATVKWDRTREVDQQYGGYNVTLTDLSPAAVARLEELGIKVSVDSEESGDKPCLKCRSNFVIPVELQGGEELEGQMGNGTKVVAEIYGYRPKKAKESDPLLPKVGRIVVLELVDGPDRAIDVDEAL